MSILKRKIRLIPYGEEFEGNGCPQVKIEESSSNPQKESLTDQTITKIVKSTSPSLKLPKDGKKESRLLEGSCNTISGIKIIRNYAKALCAFAHSSVAAPYLRKIIEKNFDGNYEITGFQKLMKQKKRKVGSIESLKALLLIQSDDTREASLYKKLFTEISVIFLKFFAVNWLFHGNVKHRIEHLKYRHKMLRRVQNPELFTFLKGSVRRQV